ncbi:MAG TPA: glycosyltransferase [Vicinamibacterales bacterium]|nr:glycosyltransferase [Vicinamibacterales bacterium]
MPPSSPLTVVHVVASLDIGGLERVVFDLVTHADRSRVTPRVVCLEHTGDLAPRFVAAGVRVDCLPRTTGMTRRILRLARFLRDSGADVMHAHNVKAHLHGALAARLAGVPVAVSTKHGRNFPTSSLSRAANRLACNLCSDLVGVSNDCAAIWRDIESADASKVSVVTNGIDLDAFPLWSGTHDDPPRAVSVARLSTVKDPFTLLEATRRVVDHQPGFRLDLVGDGPLRAEVEAAIRQLRLSDAVRVLGNVDDVGATLRGASFFVLASTSEGISLTLLEAMATGLPVVATRVGGTPEVVSHGETGLLVPPRSPEQLAHAMLWLSRRPDIRRRMGCESRRRVEGMFNVLSTVNTYEEMYLRAFEAYNRRAGGAPQPQAA